MLGVMRRVAGSLERTAALTAGGAAMLWLGSVAEVKTACTTTRVVECQVDQPSYFFDDNEACNSGGCPGTTNGDCNFHTVGCEDSPALTWYSDCDCS
jgi:hypothetical protein